MFSDPVKNLIAFGIPHGGIVADLGAGTGFYSILAGRMAPRGKVYAVDISQEHLAAIRHKVKDARLHNVEVIWGNIEKPGGTKLRDGLVDAVIASNVLFQLEDKHNFLEEIKRILRPGGRVLLVDWSRDSLVKLEGAIHKSDAHQLFTEKGFVHQRDINAGAHHYGMIWSKQ